MTSPILTFDEAAHRYYMDGQPVPGVTSIISAVIPRRFNPGDYYLQRGSALHRAIHLLTLGKLDMSSVDESYKGKLDAFVNAKGKLDMKIVMSERMLGSAKLRYAGTLDCLAIITAALVLVDFKSSYSPEVVLQLAAYYNLLDEAKLDEPGWCTDGELLPSKAMALELKDDGQFKCHWYTKREIQLALQTFKSVLTVHNFMQINKLTPTKESAQ